MPKIAQPGYSRRACLFGATLLSLTTASARADVTLFSGLDSFDSWASAAGPYTTIAFNDLPVNTWVTDEYESSGVIFNSDDPDIILGPGCSTFILDCWGLNGVHHVGVDFTAPTFAFSYHHPGKHQALLYSGGEMIYASPALGGSGVPFFDGLVSTRAFDRIEIIPWLDNPTAVVYIDNIYFSSIPAPSVLAALLVGAGCQARQRQRAKRRG